MYKTPYVLGELFGGLIESLEIFISCNLFSCQTLLSKDYENPGHLPFILSRLILMVEFYRKFQTQTAKRRSIKPQICNFIFIYFLYILD